MSDSTQITYQHFCLVCFDLIEVSPHQHPHRLLHVQLGDPGSDQRKPIRAANGELLARAPRWILEALQRSRQVPKGQV